MEQQAIHSLAIGSIYALLAVGLTLVYAGQRSLYFAYGGLSAVGGYVAWWTIRSSRPIGVGLLLAAIGGAMLGLLLMILWRWVCFRRSFQVSLLHGLGILICMAEGWRLVIGPYHRKVIAIDSHQIHYVGPLMFSDMHWLVFGCAFGCLVVLQGFLTTRRSGRAIMVELAREDRDIELVALSKWWRLDSPWVVASAIGGALAGVSGVLGSLYINDVHPAMGVSMTHKILCIALIGRLGSLRGAVCAAYGIALVEGVFLPASHFPVPSEAIIVLVLLLVSLPSALTRLRVLTENAESTRANL